MMDPMRGNLVVAGLVGAILLVCALIFWVGVHGGSKHEPPSAPGVGFVKAPVSGDGGVTR